MRSYLRLILFLLVISAIFSIVKPQEILINVSGYEKSAALYVLEGKQTHFIDSIETENNTYHFNGKEFSLQNGFYSLSFEKQETLIFIYDGNDIELRANSENISETIEVVSSESNRIYYNFVKLNKDYKTKTELLQLILARYPKEDDYTQTTNKKLKQIQDDYLHFVNVTSQVKPNSFIARYVKSAQLPVADVETPPDKQLEYLKSHSLDNIDFTGLLMGGKRLLTVFKISFSFSLSTSCFD